MSGKNNHLEIYTDGSFDCDYNIGSWCSVITCNGTLIKEINKDELEIDCSQIELFPIVESIIYCTELIPFNKITIFSDCQLIIDIFNNKKNKKKIKPIATYVNNEKCFKNIFKILKYFNVNFQWISRRSNKYAEICDTKSREQLRSLRKKYIYKYLNQIFNNHFKESNLDIYCIVNLFVEYLSEEKTNPAKFFQFLKERY